VISGAYAVLEGAPAIVSAVDRYVLCDAARPAAWTTPEVRAALGATVAPYFDATALRQGDRKLGLGSSAAILVASLAARLTEGELDAPHGRSRLASAAVTAHRVAQGGGSGIDVLASTFGGTLEVRLSGQTPSSRSVCLPEGLAIELWASGTAASTTEMLRAVDRLGQSDPARHARLMETLSLAASDAADAVERNGSEPFLSSLCRQHAALKALGDGAGVPIVTREIADLHREAREQSACFLPSGAGGGDISLFVGNEASSRAFRALAADLGHELVPARLGAQGVHVWDPGEDE
jgi:phosphomevalonate kinase